MKAGTYDDPHAHVARKRPAWTTWPVGRSPRPWSSLMLGVLVLAAVVSTRWVRVNVSPSAPLGLYRLAAVVPPLPRGTLVLLPVPPAVRPWHAWFLPLLKPVAGVPGDVVCGEEALTINGTSYGPMYREAHGTTLPRLTGCMTVPEGAVFLASTRPRSLDGRYFGMTPVPTITARMVPLWTWR